MKSFGPVDLELFNHRFSAIAEEMGVALCRSGFSPNIKERRDFSCAVFDADGELVAHAAHIPVHLGSTPLSVRSAIARTPMKRGDVVVLNDPFAGGTHLPDVTVVAPVFLGRDRRPFAYVANRAHHADIGGMTPGSMPLATEIFQEGMRLPPVRLVSGGTLQQDILALLLANTRVATERQGDLRAQVAALQVGANRLLELVEHSGPSTVRGAMAALKSYAARLMEATIRSLRQGTHTASDRLDDDGFSQRDIRIAVAITLRGGRARVDFTGTDAQVRGGVNANLPVTLSAVFYVFRTLAEAGIPANEGLMRPITVEAPPGTIVNARFPAAVAAGNVETSQRIVDVLLRALASAAPDRVPASSAGTMNNVAVGGLDPFRHRAFSYYETIAGGAGAAPGAPGASCVQTHMTNTLNTPIEGLEAYYPLRVTTCRRRWNSGGPGLHRGGDGVAREIEFLAPAHITILSERRRNVPPGLAGGQGGRRGRNTIVQGSRRREIPAKVDLEVEAGTRLRIETPGGGGWGRHQRRPKRQPGGSRTRSRERRTGRT